MKHSVWDAFAELSGRSLDRLQSEKLDRFRDWLIDEAVIAGGLGRSEVERIDLRHIGDSLLFAAAGPDFGEEVWDLGSGVGLPGIPLAILLPETRFALIERSGRRADLLERAVRILDLPNVEVVRQDIEALKGPVPTLVSRAVLGPVETARIANRLLARGGFAVVGGSWKSRPAYRGWETVEMVADPLDHPVWLLIMRRR